MHLELLEAGGFEIRPLLRTSSLYISSNCIHHYTKLSSYHVPFITILSPAILPITIRTTTPISAPSTTV